MKNLLLTVFMTALSLYAYSQAALEISLINETNEPVIGQVVMVKNSGINYEKQAVSDENGKIQIAGLSTSGLYSVEISQGGFYEPQSLNNISLISDKTKSVTFKLQEKVMALDAVTVSASSYQTINTVDAEVASELTAKEIQELPVEGRDITRSLYRRHPTLPRQPDFPEAPNVAINGANALYTNYQIDGMDNNENFLGGQRFAMPVGFTKNITALTNNFSAEHGLTSNGIINITTKSGTNETTGEAFYIVRPGPVIDAPSAFAQRDLSGNQVKDGFQRHQAGFGVGGALVKNKTFYFINAEHTTDIKDNLLNVPQLGINETVRGTNNFSYLSAKIDQHWSTKFRSSLRVNTGIVNIERQGGGLEGGVTFPSAGNRQDRNSVNVALKNTYLGERFTYEGNYLYGRFRWNYANPEDNNSPDVTVLDPQGLSIAFMGHPGYVFDELENTHVLQQKLTFYRGDHQIKTGLQIKSSGYELFGGGNPNGSYLVQLNQSQLDGLVESGVGSALSPTDLPSDVQVLNYAIELRPNAFTKRQNIFSLYLEDQWSVSPRLNLNYGIRYDYDNLSEGGGDQGDFNNIAPRLSANYKLNDKSSLRAGYGMYYDKVLYAVYSDALQFNSNSDDYKRQLQALVNMGILPNDTNIDAITNEGNLVGTAPNVSYLNGPDASTLQGQRSGIFQNELRVLNPNGYDNPYSHQFMLGYQQKMSEKTIFYVDLMHNRSFNLFRVANLNAPAAYPIDPDNVVVRDPAAADATRPVPVFADANGNYALVNGDTLRGAARNVVMTESAGRSNYYAMNFTLQKDRGEDNYAFRLMYTLSYLENNTEDINFRAMDANDFEAEWGPSINDRRHLINGIFTYYPIKNFTLTVASLLQSGQPINRIPDATVYGTTDLNGDGRAFGDAYVGNSDRQPGEDRNSDRLPWSATFDVSAFYNIPVGNNSIEIGAQVFNLFDAENLSGYSNNATQSNQIQVGPSDSGILVKRNAAPPRQFQFSLRYLF
ncbi:MAG: TonB-dependent receptor [Saprospiraceae bacterium]